MNISMKINIRIVWIVLNASKLLVLVLLMCYIICSPTLGTPTDPPLTSKTTDYTICCYLIINLHGFIDSLVCAL